MEEKRCLRGGSGRAVKGIPQHLSVLATPGSSPAYLW